MVGFVSYRLSFFPFPLSSFINSSLLFNLRYVKFGFLVASVSSSAKVLFHFIESLKLASRFLVCVLVSVSFDWLCFAASVLFVVNFVGSRNRRVFFSALALVN